MANKKNEIIESELIEPKHNDDKLQEEISKLFEMVNSLKEEISKKDTIIESLKNITPQKKSIKLVNLSGIRVHLKLSNNKNIIITRVGEEFPITEDDAHEIVNRFRSFFIKGIMTIIGEGSKEVLDNSGLDSDLLSKTNILNYKESIKFNLKELENYFRNLLPAQKELFRLYWFEEAAVENPDVLDVAKIELLNRLYNNRFEFLLKRKILKIEEN